MLLATAKGVKPHMPVTQVDVNKWYDVAEGALILCGVCAKKDIDDTNAGNLTGDERVTLDMLEEIPNAEQDAYQCDNCMAQTAGYDEAID